MGMQPQPEPHSVATNPDAQRAAMAASLHETTGTTLAQWAARAAKNGPDTHGKLVAWLKSQHYLTHGYANLVAHTALRSDSQSQAADGTDLVAAMFMGDRAPLRAIFDALLVKLLAFGDDVTTSPKKGYLSVRRSTQFATLHPSTATRFDVGIKLRGVAPAGRLEAAGSWNGMVTHRVRLTSVKYLNRELFAWLRQAYDQA